MKQVNTDVRSMEKVELEAGAFKPYMSELRFLCDTTGMAKTIIIKGRMTYEDEYEFINKYAELPFIEGTFDPTYIEMLIRYATIDIYTNVKLPEDMNEAYECLFGNNREGKNIFREVFRFIDTYQWNLIVSQLRDKIEFNKQRILQNTDSKALILAEIENIVFRLGEKISNIDLNGDMSDIQKHMDALKPVVENLSKIKESELLDKVIETSKSAK